MENRGAVIFAALLYLIGGTVLLSGSVRRSTVSEPSGEQADTQHVPETAFGNPLADSLRAEVAALKKRQRIERGVCAVVSGFTLWRFVK